MVIFGTNQYIVCLSLQDGCQKCRKKSTKLRSWVPFLRLSLVSANKTKPQIFGGFGGRCGLIPEGEEVQQAALSLYKPPQKRNVKQTILRVLLGTIKKSLPFVAPEASISLFLTPTFCSVALLLPPDPQLGLNFSIFIIFLFFFFFFSLLLVSFRGFFLFCCRDLAKFCFRCGAWS